ncbi:beta strand repeat-containing protein [Anaeromusa acidaminophila]|uniref:beta strand repeat-containing protein n=1 Tax=Anaeromusa acidaminophila TaxID=81464 RepID=UPI000375D5F6|nr:GLUG motif-containing protein [Anaeromusa acidaminophila]
MQRKWKRNWRRDALRRVYAGFLAGALLLGGYSTALAAPEGGTVAAGSATISQSGALTTINQASQKAIINWNSFNIAKGETVRFNQPGAAAIALNRVTGNNASAIYGTLSANGQVFLVNPNGVLFAKGAQVNVGGLAASTLGISDKDFLNGNYQFSGDSAKSVVNQGELSAAAKGYIALLGANAVNEGVIVAKEGTAALAAGSKVNLDFTGDGLLHMSVDQAAVAALASNKGLIQADGGLVVMSAKSADALAGTVVNNSGVIEAKSVSTKNGVIRLEGGANGAVVNSGTLNASGLEAGQTGGTVKVLGDKVSLTNTSVLNASGDAGGGTILAGGNYQGSGTEQRATETNVAAGASLKADAGTSGNGGTVVVWSDKNSTFGGTISAKGGSQSGDGGKVETSGKQKLTVADTAKVDTTADKGKTGNWLLDPWDFTVAPSGGDITGSVVSGWLEGSNVIIETTQDYSGASNDNGDYVNGNSSGTGDISINDSITWNSSNTLTLSAYNNININAAISSTNASSSLKLTSGTGNSTGSISGTGTVDVGSVAITGNNVTLNALNALKLGASNVRGNLNITSGGDVTQSKVLTVGGATTINAQGNTIALDYVFLNDKNSFTGSVSLIGRTATLASANNLMLGASTISGDLTVNSSGVVTQNGTLSVNGATTINARSDAGQLYDINLTDISNNFSGAVSLRGQNVSIGSGALKLGQTSVSGNLAVDAGGDVAQTGLVIVNGTTTLNAGTNDITLTNAYFNDAVSLTGNNVSLSNNKSLKLNTSHVNGNLTIHADGSVTQSGALEVRGVTTVSATYSGTATKYDINLSNNNQFIGPVTLTGQNVTLNTSGPLYLGDITAPGSFAVSAGATIIAEGAVNVGTFDLKGGDWRQERVLPAFSATDFRISGGSFLRALSGDGTSSEKAYQITDIYGLQGMGSDAGMRDKYYTLANNIDASGTSGWNGGAGFNPIGYSGGKFTGSFDGGGHTISDLAINRSSESCVGLFGYTNGATISNVGLLNVNLTGKNDVGGLVGYNASGTVTNSYASGSVTGNYYVGGLAGYNDSGTVTTSYAGGNVAGNYYVGGLAGYNASGTIKNSYASGSVIGTANYVGGLVGYNASGTIKNSYAYGSVTGDKRVGGLVGWNQGTVENSYASISVNGQDTVGGLVGYNINNSTVTNSYASGRVEGQLNVGGLVGANNGTVENSYASGSVTGDDYVGGLVGRNFSTVTSSYWDRSATGTNQPKGVGDQDNNDAQYKGLDSDEMKNVANFKDWDMMTIWYLNAGQSAPKLRCFGVPTQPPTPTPVPPQTRTATYASVLQGVHQPAANSGFGGIVSGGGVVTPGAAQTANLRYADGSIGRTLSVSGAEVTIGGGLVQVNLGAASNDVAVYTPGGQRTVYRFDAAHSVLSIREGVSAATEAAPRLVAGSGESAPFELLDAVGHTARFVLEYYGSGATVTAQNEAARGMLNQPQLLTAAALAAGQDQLGLEADEMKELLLR